MAALSTDTIDGAFALRKARLSDAAGIQRIIAIFAARDEMLPRALGEVYENIRDFFVIETEEAVVACGGLHVCWSHLAEIKSLAVDERWQGRGLGKSIVTACVAEAESLELRQVFALTYRPGFFGGLGFRVVDKATLPHKVWNECIRCPKFVGCSEIAVVRDLRTMPLEPATSERVELPVFNVSR